MYLEITEEMPPQINPRLCVSNCKVRFWLVNCV